MSNQINLFNPTEISHWKEIHSHGYVWSADRLLLFWPELGRVPPIEVEEMARKMGLSDDGSRIDIAIRIAFYLNIDSKIEAYNFAIDLIMPAWAINYYAPGSDLNTLSNLFQVPQDLMRVRLEQLFYRLGEKPVEKENWFTSFKKKWF